MSQIERFSIHFFQPIEEGESFQCWESRFVSTLLGSGRKEFLKCPSCTHAGFLCNKGRSNGDKVGFGLINISCRKVGGCKRGAQVKRILQYNGLNELLGWYDGYLKLARTAYYEKRRELDKESQNVLDVADANGDRSPHLGTDVSEIDWQTMFAENSNMQKAADERSEVSVVSEEQPRIEEQPGIEEQPRIEEQPGIEEQPRIEQQPGIEEEPSSDAPISALIVVIQSLTKQVETFQGQLNSIQDQMHSLDTKLDNISERLASTDDFSKAGADSSPADLSEQTSCETVLNDGSMETGEQDVEVVVLDEDEDYTKIFVKVKDKKLFQKCKSIAEINETVQDTLEVVEISNDVALFSIIGNSTIELYVRLSTRDKVKKQLIERRAELMGHAPFEPDGWKLRRLTKLYSSTADLGLRTAILEGHSEDMQALVKEECRKQSETGSFAEVESAIGQKRPRSPSIVDLTYDTDSEVEMGTTRN